MKSLVLAISLAAIAAFISCGKAQSVDLRPSIDCLPGTAQILVFDGLLKTACGCDEGIHDAAPSVNCTVSRGTAVAFDYTAAKLDHQIAPAEGSGFALLTSPPYEPRLRNHFFVYAVRLDEAGTYNFRDLFSPNMSGSVIVR